MDRKQLILQRARECFADRFNEVVTMVKEDREALREFEEPAHLRAALRRTIRGREAAETVATEVATAEEDLLHRAGETEPRQQRDALGQLLEAGAAALERVSTSQTPELTAEELSGLECIFLIYARPALLVSQGELARVPPFWKVMEDQREAIQKAQQAVGRIELMGHPEYDWVGTGFLIGGTCVMTTRRTVEIFAEGNRSGQWQFRPGITAWMDYQSHYRYPASAAYRIQRILGMHDRYDLALLEVEPPQVTAEAPTPLPVAMQPPRLEGRPVYLVGYPVRDARRNEPESLARVFRDVYNTKRVQPGTLRGILQFMDVYLLQHDCAPLGQATGSCLIDLETHQVLGLHLSGRYLEPGTAIPLWVLRDEPLLKQGGVRLAEATEQDPKEVIGKV